MFGISTQGSQPAGEEPGLLWGLPPSKSILQRAIFLGSWAGGRMELGFPPGVRRDRGFWGEDVACLVELLSLEGLRSSEEPAGWVLNTPGFRDLGGAQWEVGESATSARLLTVALAFAGKPGQQRSLGVSGSLAQRQSPALFAALQRAGIPIAPSNHGSWPLTLVSGPMPRALYLENPSSSQEVSALLCALALEGGGTLTVRGKIPSTPYLHMSLRLLADLGARWSLDSQGPDTWVATCWQPVALPLAGLSIESDASAAAVACAAGLLAGKDLRVAGLPPESLQGDLAMLDHLSAAGASVRAVGADSWCVGGTLERGFDLDLAGTPDLAPPLVALGAAKALGLLGPKAPSRFQGLETLEGKESPRLTVLAKGLQTLGLRAEHDGSMLTVPVGELRGAGQLLSVHSDHRMAFAFGLLALRIPGLRIDEPQCVRKSWPDFWEQMATLR